MHDQLKKLVAPSVVHEATNRAERRLVAKHHKKLQKGLAGAIIKKSQVAEYCCEVRQKGPEEVARILPQLKFSAEEFHLLADLWEKGGTEAIAKYEKEKWDQQIAIARAVGIM